jgi:hypothetical protein
LNQAFAFTFHLFLVNFVLIVHSSPVVAAVACSKQTTRLPAGLLLEVPTEFKRFFNFWLSSRIYVRTFYCEMANKENNEANSEKVHTLLTVDQINSDRITQVF